MEGEEAHRVIVFVGSKQKVKELSRRVKLPGVRIGEMHSDLEQSSREQMMLDFKSGRINVLFATDIVARGIDIDDIEMVINYDVPHEAEDYVHRVGRTARANRDGKAVTLVSEKEVRRMRGIERVLGNKIKRAANPLGEPQIPPVKSGKPKQRRRPRPWLKA